MSDPFDLLVFGDANPDPRADGGRRARLRSGRAARRHGPVAPEAAWAELMEAASSLFRVAVDAEGEALRLAVEAEPEIVKLNAAEAAGLLGRPADGRGDAFLAGLVVGLERGDPWPHALRLALGAAAANAELPGAGALDAATANALAARAEIREL